MTNRELIRELHLAASARPAGQKINVRAGDVLQLLNIAIRAEQRADIAEVKLTTALRAMAEQRVEQILFPHN